MPQLVTPLLHPLPSPLIGRLVSHRDLFATKSPAGSFHRKRSPFLPEEGRFAAMQNCIEPLARSCLKAHLRGGAGWDFLPKARPWSKHVPPGLWLRCRYPAGRAGLLDAGLSLRVLLAKAKKPARSRPGVCLGWYLRTGFLCFFALAINVSGGYLP